MLKRLGIILFLYFSVIVSTYIFMIDTEFVDLFSATIMQKLNQLGILFLFGFLSLRAFDYILDLKFPGEKITENAVASSIYYSIRFFSLTVAAALILM